MPYHNKSHSKRILEFGRIILYILLIDFQYGDKMWGTLYARQRTVADMPNVSRLMRSDSTSLHTKTAEVFLETFFGLTNVVGSVQCKDYRDDQTAETKGASGETRIMKDYTIFFGIPKSDLGNSYFETKLCLGTVNIASAHTGSPAKEPINFIVSIGLGSGHKSADFVRDNAGPIFEIKNGKSFPPGELFLYIHPCAIDDYDTPYPHEKKLGLKLVSAMDLSPDISCGKFSNNVTRGMWIYSGKLLQVLNMQLDAMTKSIKRSEEEYLEAINSGETIIRH